eukprot:545992_1
MSTETIAFEIWIILVGVCYVLGFIELYGYHQFKSMQQLIIVTKRYPVIVVAEAIISIIYLFLSLPLWITNRLNSLNCNNDTVNIFVAYSGFILTVYNSHFVVNAEAVRLWLMSFDLNYLNSSKNEQWKSQ